MTQEAPPDRTVAMVTLGCARNEVDSEELAGQLAAAGYRLVDDPEQAAAVLVNTCGFIDAAKKDSIDVLLAAADGQPPDAADGADGADGSDAASGDGGPAVVAVGCLAERYGRQLAEELPEVSVLGFDDYPTIAERVDAILAGEQHVSHTPRDRRKLLPITPAARSAPAREITAVPGHGWIPRGEPLDPTSDDGSTAGGQTGVAVARRRLGSGPYAPLKLASGCDRRCTFCAIPRWRGAFVSRPPEEIVAEARWLAEQGVVEVFCVSENTTSYGKDLGDLRLLETQLLPELAAVDGIERVRVSYLQPAEVRPGLLDALAGTPGVAPYFDLSFQHASPTVLRRMRRFGDAERFLELIEQIRARDPRAGIRSNVIVGFPGETEDDFADLCGFVQAARLDVVGVFGYSDEEDTEAASWSDKLDPDEIAERVERLTTVVDEIVAQRAEDRISEELTVLVERPARGVGDVGDTGEVGAEPAIGRAAHQGPESDGITMLRLRGDASEPEVGRMVTAVVVDTDGADLIAEPSSDSATGPGVRSGR